MNYETMIELIKRNMTIRDATNKMGYKSRSTLYYKLSGRSKTSLVERRKLAKIMRITLKELERELGL